MCRSIKTLRRREAPASEEEIEAAALQFVRKVSGYRVPSRANQAVFDRAVADVAAATQALLEGLARMPATNERLPSTNGRMPSTNGVNE